MSTRNLPFQPSLRHLKQEAKQFHKALQDGDSATMDRVREGLPRLSADATVDDVRRRSKCLPANADFASGHPLRKVNDDDGSARRLLGAAY